MPRSAIGMSEHDGDYIYDIDAYLIRAYPTATKPDRRAICSKVRENLDEELIEQEVDLAVAEYAMTKQGLSKKEDDDA